MKYLFFFFLLYSYSPIFSQTQLLVKEHPVKNDVVSKDSIFKEIFLKTLSSCGDNFASLPKEYASKDLFDSTFNILLKLPGAGEASIIKNKDYTALAETFIFKNYNLGLQTLLMKIKYSLPDDFVYNEEEDEPTHIHYFTFFQAPGSKAVHPGFPDKFVIMTDYTLTQFSIMKYN
jgi:hypothetical protein